MPISLMVALQKLTIQRKVELPVPYNFTSDPSPVEVNVTYKFDTEKGHSYAVTFIEVTRVIEIFDEYQTISNAIHVIVDPVTITGSLGFDSRTGVTVTDIIKHYLNNIGDEVILIFICDSKDGKQLKRNDKFERWFRNYNGDTGFTKLNQEILEPADDGATYISTFISLMFKANHPKLEHILKEMDLLKNDIGIEKFEGNETV